VNTPLYIELVPRTRAKRVGVALISMTLAVAFDHWGNPKLASIAELPACDALPYVCAELIAGVLLGWIIGFVALKQGTKTRKENQAPTAGLAEVAHTSTNWPRRKGQSHSASLDERILHLCAAAPHCLAKALPSLLLAILGQLWMVLSAAD
jgi:hypothetical protein